MDYKELIDRLSKCRANCEIPRDIKSCNDAITAIETLLAERDAAMEDLRGMCWCCKHGRPWEPSGQLSRLITCEYMTVNGVRACAGRRPCPHCQWRGPQKEDKHDAD